MNPKDDLSQLILSVLRSGPAHGFEIGRRIRQADESALVDGEAKLYPCLHLLEEAKYVSSRWFSQPDLSAKRIYTITNRGSGFLEKQTAKLSVAVKTAEPVNTQEPRRG